MKPFFCYLCCLWLAIANVPSVNCFVSTNRVKKKKLPNPSSSKIPLLNPTKNGVVSPLTQLNAVAPEVWTNFLPPLLGFVKSEWTVSYGYGYAVSLSALSLLKRNPFTTNNPVFVLQAAALIFYGFRLNSFLFIRNRISVRMQEFQKRIEQRAKDRGSRLTRTPTVVGCGVLFYALYAPLLLTSMSLGTSIISPVVLSTMKGIAALQWFGFLIEAIGDLTKTWVKKSQKDESFLVTSGIYSILRHPNYTGEIIGWTSNLLLGMLSGACLLRNKYSNGVVALLALSVVGWMGIVSVLLGATGNLEDRQKTDYGDTDKYKEWVNSTWSGWLIPKKSKGSGTHEITMDDKVEEESGSGI